MRLWDNIRLTHELTDHRVFHLDYLKPDMVMCPTKRRLAMGHIIKHVWLYYHSPAKGRIHWNIAPKSWKGTSLHSSEEINEFFGNKYALRIVEVLL